ncbi:MAG: hypothetical protein Q9192_009079 [Flavoplaca navasiana]
MKAVSNPSENFFQGRPNGADTMSDSVFVVALLKEPGTVEVSSGKSKKTFTAQAGANAWAVPMGAGKQTFSLTRGGNSVLSGTSPRDISADCICGIYNFNAYVGTLPAGQPDALQTGNAFEGFAKGLVPGLCQPKPLLKSPTSAGPAPAPADIESGSNDKNIVIAPVEPPVGVPSAGVPMPSSSASSSTSKPPTASTSATTSTSTGIATAGGGNKITSLSQLAPLNCLRKGQIWAGPVGSDTPAACDGS